MPGQNVLRLSDRLIRLPARRWALPAPSASDDDRPRLRKGKAAFP